MAQLVENRRLSIKYVSDTKDLSDRQLISVDRRVFPFDILLTRSLSILFIAPLMKDLPAFKTTPRDSLFNAFLPHCMCITLLMWIFWGSNAGI